MTIRSYQRRGIKYSTLDDLECCKFDFLATESPSQMSSRTLTLVASCLQKLANLVEFGAKVRCFVKREGKVFCNVFVCIREQVILVFPKIFRTY